MKRFALVIWAYAHWRPRRKVPKPRTILVVQMAKLGDMVCTTPMFRAIKQRYPGARVVVMGSAINRAVLEGNRDIDDYVVFDGIASAVRELRRRHIDAAVIAGAPDLTSLAVAYSAGVPTIVVPRIEGGTSPSYDFCYRLAAKLVTIVPHTMGQYAPREYLRLLEPLHITTSDTTKRLMYSTSAQEKAAAFFAPLTRPVIGISPSAGNKVKEWPAERFAELAERLVAAHNATVLVFGGERDKVETEAMLAHVRTPARISYTGSLSVDELKAYIAELDLFVAVDTGPIYIAEAFGIPTVDITGPVDEREQPPVGDKHVVVVPPAPRMPQMHVMNARSSDPSEARRQIESITLDVVSEACDTLLK